MCRRILETLPASRETRLEERPFAHKSNIHMDHSLGCRDHLPGCYSCYRCSGCGPTEYGNSSAQHQRGNLSNLGPVLRQYPLSQPCALPILKDLWKCVLNISVCKSLFSLWMCSRTALACVSFYFKVKPFDFFPSVSAGYHEYLLKLSKIEAEETTFAFDIHSHCRPQVKETLLILVEGHAGNSRDHLSC